MTTAYHDIRVSSQDVTALMRRINALEESVGYVYSWQFGEGTGTGDGEFDNPAGIAFDNSGNIYVADQGNDRVQKFDADGAYISQFGASGTGDGEFDNPTHITVDTSNNVYVVDALNYRIQKFNSSGTFLLKFGTYGTGDGQFSQMAFIAADAGGNVYVGDLNRVQKFNSSGTFTLKFGTYGTGNGEFQSVAGIAVDSSNYVLVADVVNCRIQRFNSVGAYDSQFGASGSGPGEFGQPRAVLIDSNDNIFVGDEVGNSRVQIFDVSGTYLTEFDLPSLTGIEALDQSDRAYLSRDSDDVVHVYDTTQTNFHKYTPSAVSLGTPDGGVAVPALTGLLSSKVAGQVMIDMQTAVEALAPYYINVDSGDPFNWTDLDSVDNLYYKAVDLADYGGAGHDYDWRRTLAEMYDAFPTAQDIGEIDDCVTLLEASALA